MSGRHRRLAVRSCIVAALAAALIERGALGVILGVAAGLVLVVMVVLEVRRSSSVFQHVRARLQQVQRWSVLLVTDDSEDWDPYADDRMAGLWSGCRVWISATATGARVVVPLAHWPSGLIAERRGLPGGITTGDEEFDRMVRVVGDDVEWRATLGPAPRRHLIALCALALATVRDRALEIQLDEADLERLESVLDLAAALSSALLPPAAEPFARVFDLAAAESVSEVRALHYRWLVAHGWNAAQVYRAAAADSDPTISTWGASQLAPADGVFR